MTNKNKEIQGLIKKYGQNSKQALQEHSRLDYLYAYPDLRENLLEWFEFGAESRLLQVGADYGAMTGLYSQKASHVDVLDVNEESLETVRLRMQDAKNVGYIGSSLAEYAGTRPELYDYVLFIGSLSENCEAELAAAKELLKPEGTLILAVCNPFGMKYWAGADRDDVCLSKHRLTELLKGLGQGDAEYYYPMPDYKLSTTVYSDGYLPKKGDLTKTLTAYDYPKYLLLDVGEAFDMVCDDGQFAQYANSYLVFWHAGQQPEREEKPVFVKYNRTRREEFQIKTTIVEQGGRRFVEKTSLTLEGTGHIWSFEEKYEELQCQNRTLKAAKPEFRQSRSAALFPYLCGRTWAEALGEELDGGAAPAETIQAALDTIFDIREEYIVPFLPTPEFDEVFGKGVTSEQLKHLEGKTAYLISNIDALLENMLLAEDGIYCLDYEWVFDFPIPCEFVQYRTLFYFYEQYKSLMGGLSRENFLAQFSISAESAALYQCMERSFQEYVHGDNQRIYLENFMVECKNAKDLAKVDGELARTKERLEQLRAENREKDKTLRKLNEVQRLTNNHVNNLEVIIKDLRHEIEEMGKTLTYLNGHEALIFKCRRRLGRAFNEKYPKGSTKRKKLSYMKEYALHPIRSVKFYSSEEGKNLKAGDFEIGESYRRHGKLHLPHFDYPKVSIVLPAYNQVHYTYDCLVSILENTGDVSYEVILADDVSTDATEHIADYVEGLVICRNSSNQGFLRNCNQAARQAKGEYLMFLNNDTRVTEGWLSSLVDLMESDSAIGMTGSKLVYPDGRLQEAGGIIWSDGSGWNYGRLDDPGKSEYNYVKEVDYISGAAILLPLQLWKQIGGFDSRFAPAYYEDVDLAFEVRKAGYKVVYQPLSTVIHYEGISNGTDVEGSGLKRYQAVNAKKFCEKWNEELKNQYENTGNPDPFRARERSRGKQIVLAIDHYVPEFDRDAGSKSTYQHLCILKEKGYEIKFLGDNFLHAEPYSTIMQQQGIEILYGQDYQTGIWDWLKEHGRDISYVYLNRPHIAVKYMDFIRENTDIKVVYYGVDLHFLREGREYALTGDVEKRDSSMYWKSIEMSLLHKADMSYYPSYVERDMLKEMDETIPVKYIPIYGYQKFLSDIPDDFEKREGLLFVGGFAHPPNADAVKWFAEEIFPKIRECMDVNFYIVGSKAPEEIVALQQPGNGIIVKGFVSEEELIELYRNVRVVVVPLRFGAGVKGKVIEALYNGLPIVTTPIGAEGIPHVEQALAIREDAAEFAAETVALYQDTARCREMSHMTQTFVRTYFSEDAIWDTIAEDFEPVEGKG